MKITKASMKFHQINKAMEYIVDSHFTYTFNKKDLRDRAYTQIKKNLGIIEFGVGRAQSLRKIVDCVNDNNLKVYIMGYDSWEGLIEEEEGVTLFPKYEKGAYKFDCTEALQIRNNNDNVFIRSCTFDSIPKEDANKIGAAILVHIDSDIYLSAKQALEWCFKNKLVISHTLFAFDEYDTVGPEGGERRAWEEIVKKYNVKFKEVWSNLYTDKNTKTDVIQKIFEIIKIGD